MRTGCDKCGAEPAKVFTSRKRLGMIVFGKTWRRQGLLCRQHALAMLSGDLIFGLILGWRGVVSFFVNIAAVIGQIAELAKVKSLPGPALAAGAPASAAARAEAPGTDLRGAGNLAGW